jgi:hypothetical protein
MERREKISSVVAVDPTLLEVDQAATSCLDRGVEIGSSVVWVGICAMGARA